MSFSEDPEDALSKKMSKISIEPSGNPPTNGSDMLAKQMKMLRGSMTFFETEQSVTAPAQHLEPVDKAVQPDEWRNEYHQQRMINLLQLQGRVGMTEFNTPCLHCRVCRNNKQLKREEAGRSTRHKLSRQELMQRKIQAAKVEREREVWKRRNIEGTILNSLLTRTQNLIDGLEGFHHLRSRPSQQQPSPQNITSDNSETMTLSDTDSVTSSIPTDLD